MSYTASEFQKDCLRSKSDIYRPDLVRDQDGRLEYALDVAAEAGREMRLLKKACFGGKPIPDDEFDSPLPVEADLDAVTPDMLHAVMGIINESGELAEMIYATLYKKKPLDVTNFVEEAGDSFWFWMLALHSIGVSPEEVFRRNINKLKVRYPGKFDATQLSDENRDKDAEKAAIEGR